MLIIHDPLGWAEHKIVQEKDRLHAIEKKPVGRAAAQGEWPSQRRKDIEVAHTTGRIDVLDELIEGLKAPL